MTSTKTRPTHITITTRNVGIHFGTVGQVRRGRDGRGRVIHETAPYPYGFRAAAADAAKEWAVAHDYIHIDTSYALGDN
jgi:hypothetical protein